MIKCNFCKKEIKSLVPWRCSRCRKIHCTKHRLPEYHKCSKNKQNNFFEPLSYDEPKMESKKPGKIYNPFKTKPEVYLKNIKKFLIKRSHRKYNSFNRLLKNLFFIVVLWFTLLIIYTNIEKLNEILFIGFFLIIINFIFLIKFVIKLFYNLRRLIRSSRNWVKIILSIFVLILVFQAYETKETLFDDILDKYNSIDFEKIINSQETMEEVYLGVTCSLVDDSTNTKCQIKCQDKSMDYKEFYCEGETQDSPIVCVCMDEGSEDNSLFTIAEESFDEIGENFNEVWESDPERKIECIETFNYLNDIRDSYGKNKIDWNEDAYKFAVDRSKDMYDRNYFDHVTPEGLCAERMKGDYGFNSNEYLAENIGGMSYYSKGDVAGTCVEALEGWLNSRGHRYNLLYDEHVSGAIGCYYELCTFFGVNHDLFGEGCSTGEEGSSFWEDAPNQPGEV